MRPRYTRGFLWGRHDLSYVLSASYRTTLEAEPFPRPPPPHMFHSQTLQTVRDRPELFKVVTPIKVDAMIAALADHPNRPLVESLRVALTEGFWPWARLDPQRYPHTHDASGPMPVDIKFLEFMRKQRDAEISVGRFSPTFGAELLPGMYCMPQHVVEQRGKCRLITNHSYGSYSLNSLIAPEDRSLKLDGVRSLATLLITLRRQHGPQASIVLFKDDASQAYRRMPMHPLWQAFQALRFDGLYYVDRNNVFGGAASGRIWTEFYAFVVYLAEKRGLRDLKTYIDDTFSAQVDYQLTHYAPYGKSFPLRQTRLLTLWDELGILHEPHKQLYGQQLTIVGFEFDSVAMTVTMPLEARSDLCAAITEFCSCVDLAKGKRRRSVLDVQRMIGWINWALNVFPLLRPGLTLMYERISDKAHPHTRVYINEDIARDLRWIKAGIQASDGVFLLEAIAWDENDTSAIVIHTDASMTGMGFWVAARNLAMHAPLPCAAPVDTIFYYEALVVLCAVRWAAQHATASRLLIYSDNYNTVNIFGSFAAKKSYYPILMETANILIDNKIELRVVHIPGHRNDVADLLSRQDFSALHTRFPGLAICDFQPDSPQRAGSQ